MKSRKTVFGALAALGLLLGLASGCDTATNGALVDLTASTSGGLLQILVSDVLTKATTQEDPNFAVPLVNQHH